jgi:hypothetical protein
MKYKNSYFPDIILTTSAQVKELQETNPDPRNFFWILSDLTVDTEVSETNDYNDLDNTPDLSQYLPITTEHNDLLGIQGGAPDDYQHVTQESIDEWNDYPNRTHNKLGVFRDPSTLLYEGNLSYNATTRELSISADTTVYPQLLLGEPITLPAGIICTHPNVTATYFIYFDKDAALVCGTTPWNLLTDCPIALVYYNATQVLGICFEERHAHDRNPEAHKQQHLSIGTFCNPCPVLGGYTLSPASPTNVNNQYSLTEYTIYDEDIKISQAAILSTANKKILSRGTGGVWNISNGNSFGYLSGTYIQYNPVSGGNWSLSDLANNEYVNYYIFSTTSIDEASRILTIPSQLKHSTLASAQSELVSDALDVTTLPLQEWVLQYKITYRTGASYSTTGKARIENVINYSNTSRESTISGGGISQAFADATYLRLDATNDPLTGDLTVNANVISQGFRDTTFTGTKPLGSDASGNIVEVAGYGYYVHTQSVASTNWTFANPLARRCNVDLYDSANNKFLAEVMFSSDNLTITVTLNRALIGTAVLG